MPQRQQNLPPINLHSPQPILSTHPTSTQAKLSSQSVAKPKPSCHAPWNPPNYCPEKDETPVIWLLLDSVLPYHASSQCFLFHNYKAEHRVLMTIYRDVIVEGTGTLHLRIATLGQHHNVTLHNCLHIPNAPGHGLLSIPHLLDLNYSIMLAGHSPHLIVSHMVHHTTPNLLKYFPLSHLENLFFLKAIFIEALPLTHSILIPTSSHPPHPHQPLSLSTILSTMSTSLTGPQSQAIAMSSISPFIRLAFSPPPGLTPTPTPLSLPLPSWPPVPPQSPIFPSQQPPLPPWQQPLPHLSLRPPPVPSRPPPIFLQPPPVPSRPPPLPSWQPHLWGWSYRSVFSSSLSLVSTSFADGGVLDLCGLLSRLSILGHSVPHLVHTLHSCTHCVLHLLSILVLPACCLDSICSSKTMSPCPLTHHFKHVLHNQNYCTCRRLVIVRSCKNVMANGQKHLLSLFICMTKCGYRFEAKT